MRFIQSLHHGKMGAAPRSNGLGTRRRLLLSLAACAVLLGTAAAGNAAQAQERKAPAPVKVGILSSLSEAPILFADALGYFREEGIEVEIVTFANSAEMVAPLGTGQIDVGSGAPTLGLFNAIERGISMKLVADKGRNSKGHGFNAIVVRQALVDQGKVRSLKDLKGLKIASPSRWSPMELQLEMALDRAGLTRSDVDLELMRFPDMLPALANGSIDGALLIEPFVTQAVGRKFGHRLVGVDEFAPDFQIAGIIYGPGFASSRPETARRWMVAYLRGVRAYLDAVSGNGDREALIEVLMKNTRMKKRELYDDVIFPGFDRDGYLHLSTISASIEWLQRNGQLRSAPELNEFVDYQYLDYAHQRLGRTGARETVQ